MQVEGFSQRGCAASEEDLHWNMEVSTLFSPAPSDSYYCSSFCDQKVLKLTWIPNPYPIASLLLARQKMDNDLESSLWKWLHCYLKEDSLSPCYPHTAFMIAWELWSASSFFLEQILDGSWLQRASSSLRS